MKALAVLRVSTTSQQIDDQREELYAYIKDMGYDEIVSVEAIGASAVKLDAKYMEMAEKIKSTILDGGIDAVCVWEISRLGRNEVILMDFKEFFIKNKVQFISKNPSLKLLNDDGSVNAGTELAFSLFATMAKQEAQENKARFKRAKSAMMSKGLYVGGNVIKFGYKVQNKTFVEDEEQGKIVRTMFQLYSTGEYSTYTLEKELKDRGMNVSGNKIGKMLRSRAYVGDEVGENGMHYPQIISNELWDKCEEVRKKNFIDMKRGERQSIGAKIVKCYKCGATCTSSSKYYVCCRGEHHGECSNRFRLKKSVADELLERVAQECHLQYLMHLSETEVESYKETIKVLEEKLQVKTNMLLGFDEKKARIVESYMDGLIDREKRDLRLAKVEDDIRVHRDAINSLQERIAAITSLIENHNKSIEEGFDSALDELDLSDLYVVVHMHIKSLTAKPISYGHRDPRTKKENAVEIVITTMTGNKHKFLYFPRYYEKHNLYVWNGKRWVGDRFGK